MASRRHSSVRTPLHKVATAASLLALVLLLTFPTLRARHFTQRFRAPQTVYQIQRHIFAAQPQAAPVVMAASHRVLFRLLAEAETAGQIKTMAGLETASWVPLPRLLLRFRLGSARDSASDPLL